MIIEHSQHIKLRLKLRGIDADMPEMIFREAQQHYEDIETGHLIAVKKHELYGKERDVMVAYRLEPGRVILLTIHPLKEGQVENRLDSKRWRAL